VIPTFYEILEDWRERVGGWLKRGAHARPPILPAEVITSN
jgi:hypothetical protein